MDTDGLPLADAIASLRDEIRKAILDADEPEFAIDAIELELQMVATRQGEGKAGFSVWRVVTAEAGGSRGSERTHRVLLKLRPVGDLRVGR